jgi:DNA-binding transcriptional ArsR family regulator
MTAARGGKNLKNDPKSLGSIVAHPTRSKCLTLLADREASPNELAQELGEELTNVAYHIRGLLKLGAIELVRERQVRGSVEHYYRATIQPYLSDEEIVDLPIQVREIHAREMFAITTANASSALEAGTICARDDYHLCRVPLRVDEQAWEELADLYGEILERVFQIRSDAVERVGADGVTFPVIAFQGFFEMPERPSLTPE